MLRFAGVDFGVASPVAELALFELSSGLILTKGARSV